MIKDFTFRLNGKTVKVSADEDASLLLVLRNDVGLNSLKTGCDGGQCYACSVLRNGIETTSCTVPVHAVDGCEIVTAEGFGETELSRALQAAFFEEQASQCGYCIPGMMIGANALLEQNPSPSVAQIKTGLERHVCRCGAHARIIAAVQRAANETQELAGRALAGREDQTEEQPAAGRVTYESAQRLTNPEAADSWVTVSPDGAVTAYCGKIDMGTGTRTAFVQLVAEELDVPIGKVDIVMGDTGATPDQGKTTASTGITIGAQPLQVAARETRAALMARAAKHLGIDLAELDARDGVIFAKTDDGKRVSYGDLIGNQPLEIDIEVVPGMAWGPSLKGKSALKSPKDYRYVGKSVRRQAIAEHITGAFEFVHNVRVPGMLHGRVVRPSSYGGKLISIDEDSIRNLPGVQIVRRGDFVGVVAEREDIAVRATRQLRVQWEHSEVLGEQRDQFAALRGARQIEEQVTFDKGDVTEAIASSAHTLEADFHLGYQLHAMLGPSCAVADVGSHGATIWSGSQWPQGDRADLAQMLELPFDDVRLIWREAAGSYGRLGCDDAAADAAIMSQIVGRPVRVQWTRADENGWEPVGAGVSISVKGALDGQGRLHAIDYRQWSASHSYAEKGNFVAWRLIGTAPGHDRLSGAIGDLPYDIENQRARCVFVEPTFRTIYFRCPGSFQSHFATESLIDELALMAGADPIEFRLPLLGERERAVLNAVKKLAGWKPGAHRKAIPAGERILKGRGVAFARHGVRATMVAIVADVSVDRETGRVLVTDVFVAQDCGLIVNPDGVLNQVQGNIIQAISRSVKEELRYSLARITSLNWYSYPVLRFSEIPEIKVDLISRDDMPPSPVGEVATVPTAAAIANAIFSATGKRLREVPFTPERVRDCPVDP